MNEKIKISRKRFIRILGILIVLPFAGIWDQMVKRQRLANGQKTIRLNTEMDDGVTIFGEVLIYKLGEKLSVYSSKCTHLGCRIEKEKEGEFICPCHGSRYSVFDGSVTKGPSLKPLTELKYDIDSNSKELIVYLV